MHDTFYNRTFANVRIARLGEGEYSSQIGHPVVSSCQETKKIKTSKHPDILTYQVLP